MNIGNIYIYTRHSVTLRLEGSEERLKPEYSSGEFRPATVALSWGREDGEWKLIDCRVSGPKIKKDGTDSQSKGRADFAGFFGKDREKPAWLVEMISRYSETLPEVRS